MGNQFNKRNSSPVVILSEGLVLEALVALEKYTPLNKDLCYIVLHYAGICEQCRERMGRFIFPVPKDRFVCRECYSFISTWYVETYCTGELVSPQRC